MNQETFRALTRWARGRPRPLAILAPLAAFSAEPLFLLVGSRDGAKLLNRCGRRDASWDDFYMSHLELFLGLPEEYFGFNRGTRDRIAEIAQTGSLPSGEAMILPLLKPERQREILESHMGMDQKVLEETLATLAEEDGHRGGTQEELDRLVESPAFRFVIRLVMPCFVHHQETPQDLASRATNPQRPDFDGMKDLMRLDAGFIASAAAQRVLQGDDLEQSNARFRLVGAGLGSAPKPPSLREVKHRMAGFVSFIAYVLGAPLKGPDVRLLFDIRSRHRDLTTRRDTHLPKSPESLQKMLSRQRERWIRQYNPDKTFLATVRALWRKAA